MKLTELECHLRDNGCFLHHHGGNHDVWLNPANMRKASVPRHREMANDVGDLGDFGRRGFEEQPDPVFSLQTGLRIV